MGRNKVWSDDFDKKEKYKILFQRYYHSNPDAREKIKIRQKKYREAQKVKKKVKITPYRFQKAKTFLEKNLR
jgi:hypothetical protein